MNEILKILKELAQKELDLFCEKKCAEDIWLERKMEQELKDWKEKNFTALVIAYGQ